MDSLSVGRYNGQFKPARTGADWISRDEGVVDAYLADPFCGEPVTVGGVAVDCTVLMYGELPVSGVVEEP